MPRITDAGVVPRAVLSNTQKFSLSQPIMFNMKVALMPLRISRIAVLLCSLAAGQQEGGSTGPAKSAPHKGPDDNMTAVS